MVIWRYKLSFRNLEVPYFSQRENKCIWIEKYPLDSKIIDADGKHLAGGIVPNGKTDTKAKNSCNITCLAMILHYFGITTDFVGNFYFHELVHYPLKHFQQGIFCCYKIQ